MKKTSMAVKLHWLQLDFADYAPSWSRAYTSAPCAAQPDQRADHVTFDTDTKSRATRIISSHSEAQ